VTVSAWPLGYTGRKAIPVSLLVSPESPRPTVAATSLLGIAIKAIRLDGRRVVAFPSVRAVIGGPWA